MFTIRETELKAEIAMHPLLVAEIDHWMNDVDREPEDWPAGYTILDAFDDAYRAAESWAGDDGNGDAKKINRACEDILIRLGYYAPRAPGTVIMGGDRRKDLRRKGIVYDACCAWYKVALGA